MHEVLVNRLGGLSLPRKSVIRLTDRPDMTLDVYRGRKNNSAMQQCPVSWGRLDKDEILSQKNPFSIKQPSNQRWFHIFKNEVYVFKRPEGYNLY